MNKSRLGMPLLQLSLATSALAALLTACAPYVDPKARDRAPQETAQAQTGSNLPRRDKGTGAVQVDKDSMQDGLRGASRGVKSD